MDRMRVDVGEMMADLMVAMGSDAAGALAAKLSHLFDSLHTLTVTFLLPPAGLFARFSNFAEGRIRLSFHTELLDPTAFDNRHAGREGASERQNSPRDGGLVVLIPWMGPLGPPVDCIRRRGIIVFAWAPGTNCQQRNERQAKTLAFSLSNALEPRASKIVRDMLLLAPSPISAPWSPVSCDCEAAVRALPDWQDWLDWDTVFVDSFAVGLGAVLGGAGGFDGPEEAGPCIEREAAGMGLPEKHGPAKHLAEIEGAGGSKIMGSGADGMSLMSSHEIQPPDLGSSSSGIGRSPGGSLPPHGHSLSFQTAVAEANFGVDFAQHRYMTDVIAVSLILTGRCILSSKLSVNLPIPWDRVEIVCLLAVLMFMGLHQDWYLQLRDWVVAGVTIGFRLFDLWYLNDMVRGRNPSILGQWTVLVPLTHAIASFFYVPRFKIGFPTRSITALLYFAGMRDAFDAARSLVEGSSGWWNFVSLTLLTCGLAIAVFATAAVNFASLLYTEAKEAAAREKFFAEFHAATTAADPPVDAGSSAGPSRVQNGLHTRARRRS